MRKTLATVAIGVGLGLGACAVAPTTSEQQSRLDAADLFEVFNVPDEGAAARKVGLIALGGHSALTSRLNTLRGNLGFASASITVKAGDCSTSFPSGISGQPEEQDKFVQALAITSARTQIVVAQAASTDGEDIGDAIDCLTSLGVDLAAGTFVVNSTQLADMATPIADARAAHIKVLFPMGTAAYTGATAPQPAGTSGVIGVGLVQLAKVSGVWTRTAYSQTGASDPKFADFAMPGSGPIYDGSYTSATDSQAYALGLAAGVLVRDADVETPADIDGIDERFGDVTSGSVGSCSPSNRCNGVAGKDGPTGWGLPDVSAFPQFPNG
jgi:hypothetical protein